MKYLQNLKSPSFIALDFFHDPYVLKHKAEHAVLAIIINVDS